MFSSGIWSHQGYEHVVNTQRGMGYSDIMNTTFNHLHIAVSVYIGFFARNVDLCSFINYLNVISWSVTAIEMQFTQAAAGKLILMIHFSPSSCKQSSTALFSGPRCLDLVKVHFLRQRRKALSIFASLTT